MASWLIELICGEVLVGHLLDVLGQCEGDGIAFLLDLHSKYVINLAQVAVEEVGLDQ